MDKIQQHLVKKLQQLPDVTVALWKDSDLLCVFYRDKDFAHFHNDHEIDVRFSR